MSDPRYSIILQRFLSTELGRVCIWLGQCREGWTEEQSKTDRQHGMVLWNEQVTKHGPTYSRPTYLVIAYETLIPLPAVVLESDLDSLAARNSRQRFEDELMQKGCINICDAPEVTRWLHLNVQGY